MLFSALAALALASDASAATNTYRYSSDTASWNTFSSSDDGCVSTYSYIYAYETLDKSGTGRGTTSTYAWYSAGSYNYCTGEFSSAYGDATGITFSASSSRASLSGTFTVYDYFSGTSSNVDVNLSWTATGASSRSMYQDHSNWPGVRIHSKYTGTTREASVTGTIGGADLPTGGYAYITSSASGSVSITE
jgi:hypothetical protein